jgi:hypothetical protein
VIAGFPGRLRFVIVTAGTLEAEIRELVQGQEHEHDRLHVDVIRRIWMHQLQGLTQQSRPFVACAVTSLVGRFAALRTRLFANVGPGECGLDKFGENVVGEGANEIVVRRGPHANRQPLARSANVPQALVDVVGVRVDSRALLACHS